MQKQILQVKVKENIMKIYTIFKNISFMKKTLYKCIFSLFLVSHSNLAFGNIPVIDFSSITQQISSYITQIQDLMMFEKQLSKLGVDFNQLSSFISSIQDQWNKINNLNDKLQSIQYNALKEMQQKNKQTCDEFANESNFFRDKLEKEKEKITQTLKGNSTISIDSSLIEQQACANVLQDNKNIEDANKNDLIEAQNALQKNDYTTYHTKVHQVENRKKKIYNQNIQNQAQQIATVTHNYNEYIKKTDGKRQEYEKIKKELENQIKKVASKNESEKAQAALMLQQKMIEILLDQYEVMQTTSNMLAVILQYSLPNEALTQEEIKKQNENLKELDKDIFRNPKTDYKKDALGFPEFNKQ